MNKEIGLKVRRDDKRLIPILKMKHNDLEREYVVESLASLSHRPLSSLVLSRPFIRAVQYTTIRTYRGSTTYTERYLDTVISL